jgi:GDPmannose 4,6-dehydratase
VRTALVTGITGQDGAYLSSFLLDKGYEVFGTFRRLSSPNFWRLQALGIHKKVKLVPMDLSDMSSILESMNVSKPDEIYHLAAQSFVGTSFDQPIATGDVSGLATTRMLEAMRIIAKDARFYQASTSELYGNLSTVIKNEVSAFMPASPYAIAKLYAYWVTRVYREAYGLYACNGILFNHESPLRGLEFVTRKISNACARISLGLQKEVTMGNLDAKRDWGYAPDYVESMWKMLQQEKATDYVIATGEMHSVRSFVRESFSHVKLDPERYVKTDRKLFRPLEVSQLCGDPSKARRLLKWKPRVAFMDLVKMMVDEDLKRWRSWQKGDVFPWDAPFYPEDLNIVVSRYALDR